MKIIQALFILSILIITIYVSALQPKVHKHFIIAPANFKLAGVNQRPQDAQSLVLFKIGDVKTETTKEEKVIDKEDARYISEESKIIPSSFISSTSDVNKNTTTTTSSTERNEQNSTDTLAQIANMINNSNTNKDVQRYISKFGDYNNNNNNNSSNSSNNSSSKSSGGVNPSNPKACPVCKDMNNPRYKNELIAWNVWRSRIQNKIMDDSELDANYGTIFYFTFKVDKDRNIYNVRVICTDPSNAAAISAVRKAIMKQRGKNILEFPKGTNRNMVDFKGGFLIGTYSQYSSPSDYHDYENVRTQY